MLPSGTSFLKSWRENPGVGNDIFKIFSTRRGQVCAQQHMKSFDHCRGRLDGGSDGRRRKSLGTETVPK
jgi:hypothetical protein